MEMNILIAVADDGLGMGESVAKKTSRTRPYVIRREGYGIAGCATSPSASEKFYGVGSGVEIVSKLNEGTCVTLRLADCGNRCWGATVRQSKV